MDNFNGMNRSHYCGDLTIKQLDQKVTLMGWIQKSRDLGGLIFADLRDREGICQIVFDENFHRESFEKAKLLSSEYVVAIDGVVKERSAKNPNIKTGNIEVYVNELRILNTSETPPIYIKDDDTVSENLRLKYRYLDLRKPGMQRNFMIRHQVAQMARNFLSSNGFIEIETPMLTKPTPEGARDYLVPSRVQPGKFYALPQSPQLFKQLLMVSGMDRYFQIVKCFRDEDLRADRQPEFTQIDCEMSFVHMDQILEIMEEMITSIIKEVLDIHIPIPIPRITYKEAMNRFGSDKPDARFGFELVDITNEATNSGFSVFDNAAGKENHSVRGINIKGFEGSFSRKGITALEEVAKTYGAKGLAWIKINEEGIQSPIAKFIESEKLEKIIEKMQGEKGDLILFVADKDKIVFDALGHVRLSAAENLNLLSDKDFNLLYVTEFPQFEYDDDNKRFVAVHHPFTAPMDEDLHLLSTNPELVRAKAYDMVLNGVELGGGSLRIYDSQIQEQMFESLGFTKEEAWNQFGFLLEAFKFGTPPHGGIAFGLDRFVMLLCGADSIREVIAFPKNQNAICPLTNAPSWAEVNSLEELGIQVINQTKEEGK